MSRYRAGRLAMERMAREMSMAYLSQNNVPGSSRAAHLLRRARKSDIDELRFTYFGHQRLYADSKEADTAAVAYFGARDRATAQDQPDAPRDPAAGQPKHWRTRPASDRHPVRQRGAPGASTTTTRDKEWREEWRTTPADGQPDRLPSKVQITPDHARRAGQGAAVPHRGAACGHASAAAHTASRADPQPAAAARRRGQAAARLRTRGRLMEPYRPWFTVTIAVIGAAAGDRLQRRASTWRRRQQRRHAARRVPGAARADAARADCLVGVQASLSPSSCQVRSSREIARHVRDHRLRRLPGQGLRRRRRGAGRARRPGRAWTCPACRAWAPARGPCFDLNITSEEGKYTLNCGGGRGRPPTRRPAERVAAALGADPAAALRSHVQTSRTATGCRSPARTCRGRIIDWTDVDEQRYEPPATRPAPEDVVRPRPGPLRAAQPLLGHARGAQPGARGRRGLLGGLRRDASRSTAAARCKVLASAIRPEDWPLVAAMMRGLGQGPDHGQRPQQALVAQQVAGMA